MKGKRVRKVFIYLEMDFLVPVRGSGGNTITNQEQILL